MHLEGFTEGFYKFFNAFRLDDTTHFPGAYSLYCYQYFWKDNVISQGTSYENAPSIINTLADYVIEQLRWIKLEETQELYTLDKRHLRWQCHRRIIFFLQKLDRHLTAHWNGGLYSTHKASIDHAAYFSLKG